MGEKRERRAGGGFGAVRRDLGPRGGKGRGCAGRSTPGAKQRWSRTHQEFGVIFAVPGFSRPLGLSLSHCGNRRLPGSRSRLSRTQPPKRVRVPYPNLCINSPLRSFGSNQVDLGGMRSPASATASSSSDGGGIHGERQLPYPRDTLRSSSLSPLMPPMKSMRLSVRGIAYAQAPAPEAGPAEWTHPVPSPDRCS